MPASPRRTGAGAELVVPEILPGGFTLGVVVDFEEPFSGKTIPSGTQIPGRPLVPRRATG